MLIYVKSNIKHKFTEIESQIVKTGLMGTMGNKGSCLLRFDYLNTNFAFASGHYAAGASNNNSRIQEMIEILNKPFLINQKRFKEHDVFFIFGDCNFRIDLEYGTCIQLISNKNFNSLTEYDQFNKSKNVNFSLFDVEEGPLSFDPTYKYEVGGHKYDYKKKRVPSWCDRIFFKRNKKVTQINYNRVEYIHSDHKPVFSLFKVRVTGEVFGSRSSLDVKNTYKPHNIAEVTKDKLDNMIDRVSINEISDYNLIIPETRSYSVNNLSNFNYNLNRNKQN